MSWLSEQACKEKKNTLIIQDDCFVRKYRGVQLKSAFLNFKSLLASEVKGGEGGGGISSTSTSLAHGRPENGGGGGKRKFGVCAALLQVTCSSSVVVTACCPSCMNYVSSATKVFHNCLCARRLWRMAACLSQGLLGLSQGLVGRARWSGWGWLPSPSFNRRSNTVANVMCNKTHFYCSPPGGQWIGAECGKREIPHSQRDGCREAVLRRHRSERWPPVYGRNSEPP